MSTWGLTPNWDWLQAELAPHRDLIQTHFTWDDTQAFADEMRTGPAHGLHVFLHDNIFHAVYATNYIMRVVDVMITTPSELAFYPVPKIFNERVGGYEMWGAIRGAELGDGTVRAPTGRLTAREYRYDVFCASPLGEARFSDWRHGHPRIPHEYTNRKRRFVYSCSDSWMARSVEAPGHRGAVCASES